MSFQRDGGYAGLFFSIPVHNYTLKCVDPSVSSLHAYGHTVCALWRTTCLHCVGLWQLVLGCWYIVVHFVVLTPLTHYSSKVRFMDLWVYHQKHHLEIVTLGQKVRKISANPRFASQ